ncbi:hypothetical protein N7532_011847 [Penicillium argentinense]|uniref:Chromatin remodeling complex subunit n=1 Tax=Penicillium argentinense TaxID=1131581 RepID=A0A9W9EJ86_9EURO|nr:uncharacterized protein N7532_011847 [Penicillium argentinense]KAJ5082804.1 hypothetical protein N7532_011847 [Penicillium argentinense]
MSEAGDHNSPGSDDADAKVSQILNKFKSANAQSTTTPQKSPAPEYSQQPDRPIQQESPRVSRACVVIPPTIPNPDDYEYLPGHFTVRRVLHLHSENSNSPSCTVRLRSGERQTMTYDRLMQLENGMSALDLFHPSDSEDDLMVIGNRSSISQSPYFSGDGAFDPPEDGSQGRGNRRRAAARAGQYSQFYETFESDDESTHERQSDSEDDGQSDSRSSATRRLRRGNQNRKHTPGASSLEGLSAPDNRRKSSRRRKNVRVNLRERHEDDLSEAESSGPRQQKYTGAKEIFQEVQRDDEFRQLHFACCATCSIYEDDPEKGPLVFCQGCSSSYHQACLGPRSSRDHLVTKIDEGNFILQCRRCLGHAHEKHDISPHLGYCAECKEKGPLSDPLRQRLTTRQEQQQREANGGTDPITAVDMAQINNVDNVFFRCASCQRAFHRMHFPLVIEDDGSETLPGHMAHWQCSDCAGAMGEIDELVAWRPVDPKLKGSKALIGEAIPEMQKQYLVKWKQKSYFRTTWMRGDWVWGVSNHAMRRAFYNSAKSQKPIWTTEDAIPEENLRVDIVFDVVYRQDGDESLDESNPEMVETAFVKYKARWEDFKTAFNDWLLRDTTKPPDRNKLEDHLSAIRRKDFERDLALLSQPESLVGGELMRYQMEGVNWLYYKFWRKENAILADDMGLGKTVQVIGFFATLIDRHRCWPFLVVAPNSTVPNWRREIKTWAPTVRVTTYYGSAFSRETAKNFEMFPHGGRDLRSHVVIASYESMVDGDARILNKVRWAGLIVDEGQRLKNDKSQLYKCLHGMKFDFKVLLSGTPLQNTIRELFNLLQFINPDLKAEEMENEYGNMDKESIHTLHGMIRPFFLRRTKADVLPSLPPMVQIILPVSMSVVQKKLYKSILSKNPLLIRAICTKRPGQLKKAERHNLNNILVQLRKCLCHPFIYNRDIEEQTNDSSLAHHSLVAASGKLQLLNLMLPKLRDRGHRVLIFSQFLENLDLVEDFLGGLDLKYCRLDGKLTSRQKQQQIDSFNAPGSPYFAFLLSTRSGGVGINLATADTVIIMDPDFNPKQDMQALSRAHRIGQKNTVLVFHLTTKASVEEKIMQKGKKKLALDHVLIERMEADGEDEDLESILRHGAQALFDDDNSADVHYDSDSIEKILNRSQIEKVEQPVNTSSGGISEQHHFSFARVWQKERGALEEVTETEDSPADDTVWEQILRAREQQATEEASRTAEGFGRGKRKRAAVNYRTREEEINDVESAKSSQFKAHGRPESDDDFDQEETEEATDSLDEAEAGDVEPDAMELDMSSVKQQVRPFVRKELPPSPPPPPSLGGDGAMDDGLACLACNKHHPNGRCPLKLAGVEYCPLCGLAHFGRSRACPHLHDETQIHRMLSALKESKELPEHVTLAKKYLQGVLGDLGQRDRKKTAKEAAAAQQPTQQASKPFSSSTFPETLNYQGNSHILVSGNPGPSSTMVDLTGPDSPHGNPSVPLQLPLPPHHLP